MRNYTSIIVGLAVVAVLVIYSITYQVRYDQAAVVTFFGNADQDSVVDDPGLKFKLPWPIQNVRTYSTRLQLLEDEFGEQQTADGKTVVVRTYVAWSIDDPLQFYTELDNVDNANEKIRALAENVRGVIGNYRFNQLVNAAPDQVQIDQLEQTARQQLADRTTDQGYGVTIHQFGVRRLVLPETVTGNVFARMKQERETLAQAARSEGESQAAAIKSKAQTARERILAFARSSAEAIRAEGQREAAQYYGVFAQNEDFAIFLRKIEALPEILKNNTTYVFDANSITPIDLLADAPDKSE